MNKKESVDSEQAGKSNKFKTFEKDEIKKLNEKISMLKTKMIMLNENTSNEFSFQNHDCLNNNQEISNLKRQIQTLKTQNEIKNTNTERLETQIKELKVINGDYKKQIETQNQQNYYLTTENSQLKDKLLKIIEEERLKGQQKDNLKEKIYHSKKTEVTNQCKENKFLAQKGLVIFKISLKN